MRGRLALGVLAVALLFAGSVVLLDWLGDGLPASAIRARVEPAPAEVQPPAAPDEPERPAAGQVPPQATLELPGQPGVKVAVDAGPQVAPPPRPEWLEGGSRYAGPSGQPSPIGTLRPYLAAGMARLQASVATCASEPQPAGPPAALAAGRTELTLRIQVVPGGLEVVEATVTDPETALDWRVQCARRKLVGQRLMAPAHPPATVELPFVLNL